MRSYPQDVVLWAHTVQAEGIGGWESCGGALTSPTSNVVCKGKIPDSKAKVFHMTKTIICLRPLLCSILSGREFFQQNVAKKVKNLNEKSLFRESQVMYSIIMLLSNGIFVKVGHMFKKGSFIPQLLTAGAC